MPPEPLPLPLDRKNDKSTIDNLGGGSGSSRWRDTPHHYRWGSADSRRPPGYGKQMFAEDSFRGPSRSNDKILDDESYGEFGKYGKHSSREYRGGPFSRRERRGHCWDAAVTAENGTLRMQADMNEKRSMDDMVTYNSHLRSEFGNDQFRFKDQHDKNGGVSGFCTGQGVERENSLALTDWKPLRWTHSGSFSSRGSGFSNSSHSKNMGVDSSETKVEVHLQTVSAVQSPSGAAGSSLTSASPTEDVISRKKPRLGWGQGLAKFEKKKVDGSDDTAGKHGTIICESNTEPIHPCISDVGYTSPRLTSFSDCTSPTPTTTSSSVDCSSLPGVEYKNSFVKIVNVDASNLCGLFWPESQNQFEGLVATLENLEVTPIANISSSLEELFQFDNPSSVDSSFIRSTAMNKLLVLKADISKKLEVTESDIDSLENELKILSSDTGSACPCPVDLSGYMITEKTLRENSEAKNEDVYSPGTATPKSPGPITLGKPVSQNETLKHVECPGNFKTSETETLCDLIVASNKDSAHRASEVFSKLLPTNLSHVDISTVQSSPCWEINPLVKEKYAMRKRFLRFKERVISLKYRAFQHLWKEDLQLLSIRRCRAKSQKKLEQCPGMVHSGYQKHRSSIRTRCSSPAGNLSLVPTTEITSFASKLLADSHMKVYRSVLKMPPLILDRKENIISRFVSSNGLVVDPCAAEKQRCMVNIWTSEEKEILLDKLATFGKDFRKIALFLDHKTTADCVEFYYKNHKSESFQKTKKKKPEFSKQGKSYSTNTYLVTSGKRWNRDSNAASLDVLGAASEMVANVYNGMLERSTNSLEIMGNERETVAADVLVGICGSLSSEAMSSCITSSSMRRPLTPEVTQNVDDGTGSDESCGDVDPTVWTDEEKSIFIQAVAAYGKDFAMISRCVRTRSLDQCKVFFSKARKCLGLDTMHPEPENGGPPANDDASGGGGSDNEDACVVEADLVTCRDKSRANMDEDIHFSNLEVNHDENFPPGPTDMHPALDHLEENNMTGELDVKDTELRSENIVTGECAKNQSAFGGDSNIRNCSIEPLAAQVSENGFATSDSKSGQNEAIECGILEEAAIGLEANHNGEPSVMVAVDEVFVDYSRAEEARPELLLPGSSSNDKQVEIADVNVRDSSGIICSIQGTRTGLLPTGNASLSADAESLTIGLLSGCKRNCDSTTIPMLQDPATVQKEKNHDMASNFDSEKTSNKQFQKSVSTDDNHQRSVLTGVNPSQVLRGYPVSVSSSKPDLLESISKVGRKFHSDYFLHLQKCIDSKQHDSGPGPHSLSQDRLNDNARRPEPSESDKPKRNGDVKLFGQILSHPSPQPKPNSRVQGNGDRGTDGNSFNLKVTGNQNVDQISASAEFDCNGYFGLENLPTRKSFGFWDGNRIQAGFPSLPDSAILLAKYPAAFSNYSTPSSKIEQQQLHSFAGINNDRKLNGVVYPTRETSSSKIPPFMVDLKQRQDLFFSGNGFDAVSSIQQQARGIMGINVVGRGGMLLGSGACTGVSDPVAALRMHYAKTEQFAGQPGSIIRDEESCRGNGDIGR